MAAIEISGPSPKTVKALQKLVGSILNSNNDQKTKRVAIKVLRDSLQPDAVTISNSHFQGNF